MEDSNVQEVQAEVVPEVNPEDLPFSYLWHSIHLTKSERKGKTPTEIDAMRKNRYMKI